MNIVAYFSLYVFFTLFVIFSIHGWFSCLYDSNTKVDGLCPTPFYQDQLVLLGNEYIYGHLEKSLQFSYLTLGNKQYFIILGVLFVRAIWFIIAVFILQHTILGGYQGDQQGYNGRDNRNQFRRRYQDQSTQVSKQRVYLEDRLARNRDYGISNDEIRDDYMLQERMIYGNFPGRAVDVRQRQISVQRNNEGNMARFISNQRQIMQRFAALQENSESNDSCQGTCTDCTE